MKKQCKVKGCLKEVAFKELCITHYNQLGKYGYVRGRSTHDPNEFIVKGKVCRIFLYNRNSEKVGEAIIDTEDMERCKQYKWCQFKNRNKYYVMNNTVGPLAAFILGVKSTDEMPVDHINDDTLDNRKQNLQHITRNHNVNIKRKLQSNSSSGYRGVYWYVNPGKTSCWRAGIAFNRKKYNLGSFPTKELAAMAYNKKAKELFGKYAFQNKINN